MATKDKLDDSLRDAVDKATGLVDMKRTKAELKEERERWKETSPVDGDAYPYGLEIRLETASLEKLGIEKLPNVGEKLRIEAIAVVEEARSSERLGKDGKAMRPDKHLTLQIQKLGISKGGK